MSTINLITLALFLIFSNPLQALEMDCKTYSIRCDCFPAVPLEGFKLHIVEKCDHQEEWSTEYYAPVFDAEQECRAATVTDPVCKSLNN
jgi:hypothetical protein